MTDTKPSNDERWVMNQLQALGVMSCGDPARHGMEPEVVVRLGCAQARR